MTGIGIELPLGQHAAGATEAMAVQPHLLQVQGSRQPMGAPGPGQTAAGAQHARVLRMLAGVHALAALQAVAPDQGVGKRQGVLELQAQLQEGAGLGAVLGQRGEHLAVVDDPARAGAAGVDVAVLARGEVGCQLPAPVGGLGLAADDVQVALDALPGVVGQCLCLHQLLQGLVGALSFIQRQVGAHQFGAGGDVVGMVVQHPLQRHHGLAGAVAVQGGHTQQVVEVAAASVVPGLRLQQPPGGLGLVGQQGACLLQQGGQCREAAFR